MESVWLDDFFQQKKSQSKDNHEQLTVAGPGETAHVDLKFIEQRYLRFSVGDQRLEKGDDVDADAWVDVAMAAVIWVPLRGPR
ncbi:MAG: hypothetical protein R2838_16845 [Caldilineaceae bacterium]